MVGFLGQFLVIASESRLMVEQGYAIDIRHYVGFVCCIRDIGIAFRRCWVDDQLFTRDYLACNGVDPRATILYVDNIWDRKSVFEDSILLDIRLLRLFAENEATSRDAVFEGYALHRYALDIQHYLRELVVEGDEIDFERYIVAEEIDLLLQHLLVSRVGNDSEGCSSVEQRHSRYQADKAEYVVAVEVRNADEINSHEIDMHTSELELSSLGAVDKKYAAANRQDLSRRHSVRDW